MLFDPTEHLFFVFFYTIDLPIETGYCNHHPRNAIDWINFFQVIGVWTLFNILLGLNPYHYQSPSQDLNSSHLYRLSYYIPSTCYSTYSVRHLLSSRLSELPGARARRYRSLLRPSCRDSPATIYNRTYCHRDIQTTQTAAFILPAVFVPRIYVPWDLYLDSGRPFIMIANAWYYMVGFVAVDDAVFALGQGMLLWLS
ncbi:unnamed protein product [Penicillium nalgiovense]|nr:unnamed protein product [Penicillium nalgiovense]